MKKPGYLDEVKSLISEFMQYEVRKEELDKMIQDASDKPLLQMKLKDVAVLYEAFREYLSDHFMTAEEVLEVLAKEIPFSEKLKGSTVVHVDIPVSRQCSIPLSGNSFRYVNSNSDSNNGCSENSCLRKENT